MTTTPLPSITKYGIVWTLRKGNAIYKCSDGFLNTDYVDMERDQNDIPIIPSCGSSLEDDGGGDNIDAGELSWFHKEYKWKTVDISFSSGDNNNTLKGFEIEARVYSVIETPPGPDSGTTEPNRTFNGWVPYRVKSATIYSEDPNDGDTWVYDNPRNYGGVIVFTNSTPVDKEANTKFVCGISESAYNYIDVFDDVDFGYIPRNTYENKKLAAADRFQFEPLYEDVKDANGLAAPIYPMNAVTSFVPDGREDVTVTYKVSLKVVPLDSQGREIIARIENPDVTIKQKVEQDTDNYIGQLRELGKFCQFENPGGFSDDELSPNYNYDYPYTLVAGFDGVPEDGDTYVRGDDKNNEPLQKGDVLYIPNTEQRLTWSVADIPEKLTIIDGGNNYKDAKNCVTVKAYETDKNADKDRYPNGKPPRCYNAQTEIVATGLLVDIKTEDGKVISAEISDTSEATGWNDGDVIRVVGGNNNAELRIHIDNPPGWTDKFIDKY